MESTNKSGGAHSWLSRQVGAGGSENEQDTLGHVVSMGGRTRGVFSDSCKGKTLLIYSRLYKVKCAPEHGIIVIGVGGSETESELRWALGITAIADNHIPRSGVRNQCGAGDPVSLSGITGSHKTY